MKRGNNLSLTLNTKTILFTLLIYYLTCEPLVAFINRQKIVTTNHIRISIKHSLFIEFDLGDKVGNEGLMCTLVDAYLSTHTSSNISY